MSTEPAARPRAAEPRSAPVGVGLDLAGLARAGLAAFGVVPSVWLQEPLVDGPPHWYDALAAASST